MLLLSVYAVAAILLVLGAVIVTRSPQNYQIGLARLIYGFAAFGLALTATTTGLYYNYDGYFGDLWTATETINKVQSGSVSSVDYFNPIGPVYPLIYKIVALIDPTPTVATVVHASTLAAALSAGLAYVMLRHRMSGLGLAVVILSVIGVAVSGRGNGELLQDMPMHYLAPYNRWGWALFIPVAVCLALPFKRDRWADIAIGVAIALMLLLKVTYGVAALGLVAARRAFLPDASHQLGGIGLGLGAFVLGFELITGQVSAHLQDLGQAAALSESGVRLKKLFGQLGEMALFSCAALILYVGTLRPRGLWQDIRPALLILVTAAAGCTVLMQNHYTVEAAIYPLLPLIALEWTGALRPRQHAPELRERTLIAGAVAVILFFPIIDISMHLGQRIQFARQTPDPAFAGTPYANLRFEPYLVGAPTTRLNTVADGRAGVVEGLELLRAAGADRPGAGTVVALNFANPFPMLLDQPSPPAVPIWLHEGRSFSKQVFVAPEVFFDTVEFVIRPKGETVLSEIYADILTAEFEPHSEGAYWTLLRRR